MHLLSSAVGLALLLTLGGGGACAEDAAQDPAAVAGEIAAAARANDGVALAALGKQCASSPWLWLIVDELEGLEPLDASARFAAVLPTEAGKPVLDYLLSRKGKPQDAEARAAMREALRAFQSGKFLTAIQFLDGAPAGTGSLLSMRMGMLRGAIDASLLHFADAGATYAGVADASERIGWIVGAVQALEQAGNCARRAYDYAAAQERWERMEGLLERSNDPAGAATALADLAGIAAKRGDYPRALRLYDRAISDLQLAGAAQEATVTLGNTAQVYAWIGEFTKALTTQQGALSVLEAAHAPPAYRADACAHLGSLYDRLGDSQRSMSFTEKALGLYREAQDREGEANALGDQGITYSRMGDTKQALELMGQAQAIFEAEHLQEGLALVLGNEADVRDQDGDYSGALTLLRAALQAHEAVGDAGNRSRVLGTIADVYRHQGKHGEALAQYDKALAEAQRLQETDVRVFLFDGIAKTQLAMGAFREAAAAARQAITELAALGRGLPEGPDAEARGQQSDVYETGARAAIGLSDADALDYFLEAGRAGALLAALGGRDAIGSATVPPELLRAEHDAQTKSAETLKAYYALRDDSSAARKVTAARWEEYAKSKEAVRAVEERIQGAERESSVALAPRIESLSELRPRLGDGEAMVLYGMHSREALALVVTRKGERVVKLGAREVIDAACAEIHPDDATTDSAPAIATLRGLLVDPLGLAATTTRLMVSPHGAITFVPFSLLAGDREVVYLPSGTIYVFLLEDRARRGDGVLALGDPEYLSKRDPQTMELLRGGRALVPLPGTREEVNAIGDVKLLGKDASEAGLEDALAKKKGRWHAVHFACHGLVDPERPTLSSLALSLSENRDGFLTALEVFRLKIPADLVVLSACESGRGKVVRGEGLVGLARSFMYAGAPRVLCSLWRVDDQATRALMTKFYELWNPKDGSKPLGAAAALRRAQEFVRSQEKWKRPYFWAAWVIWGLPD